MAIYERSACRCYVVWGSVLPPPPCPVHTAPNWHFTTSPNTSVTTYRPPCRGKHCAHDFQCFGTTINYTATGTTG